MKGQDSDPALSHVGAKDIWHLQHLQLLHALRLHPHPAAQRSGQLHQQILLAQGVQPNEHSALMAGDKGQNCGRGIFLEKPGEKLFRMSKKRGKERMRGGGRNDEEGKEKRSHFSNAYSAGEDATGVTVSVVQVDNINMPGLVQEWISDHIRRVPAKQNHQHQNADLLQCTKVLQGLDMTHQLIAT